MFLVGNKNIAIMPFDYTVSYTIIHQEEPEVLKMQSIYYTKYWLATIIICTLLYIYICTYMYNVYCTFHACINMYCYARMHACTHVHTHTHAHMPTCMHTYTHAHACPHERTHAHTHTYTCTHARTRTHTGQSTLYYLWSKDTHRVSICDGK